MKSELGNLQGKYGSSVRLKSGLFEESQFIKSAGFSQNISPSCDKIGASLQSSTVAFKVQLSSGHKNSRARVVFVLESWPRVKVGIL